MEQNVVEITEIDHHIVQVRMQDRDNKNTFSEELAEGLIHAFEKINANKTYKVVVLTGYENYFACGGTQESLLKIYEGTIRFTDMNIYSLALDCKIPVIAAMQGHGIGGGFVMGLFADFVILSKESIYTTNFMRYGFTPGMGATYIVQKKLGFSLAEELLFTARNYRGGDLEKRGIPFPVYPRAEVMEAAYQMAAEIADKPRASLILLKDHLTSSMREKLPGIIEKEVALHEKTFHLEEVKERIEYLFDK